MITALTLMLQSGCNSLPNATCYAKYHYLHQKMACYHVDHYRVWLKKIITHISNKESPLMSVKSNGRWCEGIRNSTLRCIVKHRLLDKYLLFGCFQKQKWREWKQKNTDLIFISISTNEKAFLVFLLRNSRYNIY